MTTDESVDEVLQSCRAERTTIRRALAQARGDEADRLLDALSDVDRRIDALLKARGTEPFV